MKTIIKILFACTILTVCFNAYGQEGEIKRSTYDRAVAIGVWIGNDEKGITYEVNIFPTSRYSDVTKRWVEGLQSNISYKKGNTVIRKIGFGESDIMLGGLRGPNFVSLYFVDNENKAGGNIEMTVNGDSATWIYRESGMPVNKDWEEAGKSDLPKTLTLQRISKE